MAFRRCQVDGHPIMGRSNLVYFGLVGAEDETRWRLRFCSVHARAVHQDLSQYEVSPDDGTLSGGDLVMTQCLSCGQPVDELGWRCFLTTYPTKNERKDYWASLHVNCRVPTLLAKGTYAE